MKFRSIFGSIIFIVLASFLSIGLFVQTKSFGRVVTKVINDFVGKKLNVHIDLQSVKMSFFPPGIEINKVRIEKHINAEEKVWAEFGQLGFYVGLIELEERRLTFGEIKISDSVVDYKFVEKNKKPIEMIESDLIDQIFSFDKKLPVRVDTVLFENAKVLANGDLVDLRRLKLFKKNKSFMLRFHLSNINTKTQTIGSIDEVWGEAEIGKKNIDLHRFKIQHDVHSLLLKGKVLDYPLLKKASYHLAGESTLYLNALQNILALPPWINFKDGFSIINLKLKGEKGRHDGTFDIAINDLKSSIVHAEQIISSFGLREEKIFLKKLEFSHKDQKIHLLKEVPVFDIETGTIFEAPVVGKVENLRIGNVLRFMPQLKPIKGYLNGDIEFKYDGDYHFTPLDGFYVNNLGLFVGTNGKTKIITIKKTILKNSKIKIVNGEFQLESALTLPNSNLTAIGYVNSKEVNFIVGAEKIDLWDLGNVSDLGLKGNGALDLKVEGGLEDVKFNFKGAVSDFEIIGYRLGKSDIDLSLLLKDSLVLVNKFDSKFRNTILTGSGAVNWGNKDIALDISSPRTTYGEVKDIMSPVLSKITFLPKDFDMTARVGASIFGKMRFEDLKVSSNVQFNDLVAYGENFNSGKFRISLSNNQLSLDQLVVKKVRGQFTGDYHYNFKSQKMDLKYQWANMALNTFNLVKKLKLNLNGLISGSLAGDGRTDAYKLNLTSNLSDTRSEHYQYSDSGLKLAITPEMVEGSGDLLGSIVKANIKYVLAGKEKSRLDLVVDIPELKPIAVGLLGQHMEAEKFQGSVKANLHTSFRRNFEEMNFESTLEKLVFDYETFNINYFSTSPQFVVENDIVKAWNLHMKDPALEIRSSGSGKFGERVQLIQEISFNSKVLELFIAPILACDGKITNTIKIEGLKDKYDLVLSSKSAGLNLMLDGLNFPLTNINYDVDLLGTRLVIKEANTGLENGTAGLRGDVYFDSLEPDVNIKYYFDKAEIPVLGKSFMNLSGEGIILGNQFPYSLSGELVVNKAQIVNEISDFGQKTSAISNIRYLPQGQESLLSKLFNLNVNIKLENPARVANSLMDLNLKGEIRLLGNPARLRGEGRIYTPINSSRIFFKNNEYMITNADLNFTPRKPVSNPDFDIQALTLISNYKITSKAYGDLEHFNFDLTSDPALPKNSILSLIAFGYTDEIQNTLRQDDQQNLTEVGVGSFVFDRFKISDILNKQFGLQVNLGTVFEQSQDSLINSRSSEGQSGGLGRTRSATRIELKKRLNEAMTLSVSSTMGGSIGQRQSMNLNYGFNKNVQAEGVYELRTIEEGRENNISNSIGADLKFRWTFK